MQKILIFMCLVFNIMQLRCASLREEVRNVVARNNQNVQRTQDLYAIFPPSVVKVIFGYMREKLRYRGKWFPSDDAPSLQVFDANHNEHRIFPDYFRTTEELSCGKSISIAFANQDALRKISLIFFKKHSYGGKKEIKHQQNLVAEKEVSPDDIQRTLPSVEEVLLAREEFGQDYILRDDDMLLVEKNVQ